MSRKDIDFFKKQTPGGNTPGGETPGRETP